MTENNNNTKYTTEDPSPQTENSWEELKSHHLYEICKEYPYNIREKGKLKNVSVSLNPSGYEQVALDGITYGLHRIIALQWLPNPDNLREVNHKDGNRSNNHLDNLEWISTNDNRKDRKPYQKRKAEFLNELPESAVPLNEYNNYEYDRFWFDYESKRLIVNSRNKWRLVQISNNGSELITLIDINGKSHTLSWNKFLKEMERRIE